jgi:hypothetical protein
VSEVERMVPSEIERNDVEVELCKQLSDSQHTDRRQSLRLMNSKGRRCSLGGGTLPLRFRVTE